MVIVQQGEKDEIGKKEEKKGKGNTRMKEKKSIKTMYIDDVYMRALSPLRVGM